jgi:ribosome biogenesis GTPase
MSGRRLTKRQRQRIRQIQERRKRRLGHRVEEALAHGGEAPPREGRVITRHGVNLVVEDLVGDLHHCLFRQNLGQVVCGDRVVWHSTGKGEGVVSAVLDRTSVLSRPDYSGRDKALAANISQLVVVLAPTPEPSEYLVDQYLVAAETIGVRGLLVINKIDLLDAAERTGLLERFAVYAAIGYPLIAVSARQTGGLAPLLPALRSQTSILVGQSGAGKSSLVKALLPNLGIQIGKLSQATGLGRHTTSATTLYRLPGGGKLIDSPGVRSFRLGQLDRQQLGQGFREFRPYLGRCRFSDCSHQSEPGCALRAAVTAAEVDRRRLENFLHMAADLARVSRMH